MLPCRTTACIARSTRTPATHLPLSVPSSPSAPVQSLKSNIPFLAPSALRAPTDLLAGRKTVGTTEGHLTFGGVTPTPAFLRRYTGYVEQFDTLLGDLTVREMLLYTAELKRPVSESLQEKKEKVGACVGVAQGALNPAGPSPHARVHLSLFAMLTVRTSYCCHLIASSYEMQTRPAHTLTCPMPGLWPCTAMQVEALLRRLALDTCADVPIGDPLTKGISGGQAKRTNVSASGLPRPDRFSGTLGMPRACLFAIAARPLSLSTPK